MSSKKIGPAWWQLYFLFIVIIGVIFIDEQNVPIELLRRLIEGVCVVMGYGLAMCWLRANAGLIMKETMEELQEENKSKSKDSRL